MRWDELQPLEDFLDWEENQQEPATWPDTVAFLAVMLVMLAVMWWL